MTTAYYEYPIERFMIKIIKDDHFVMSRFNDGEWYCMRREYRNNLESHPCYEELSNDMLTAITNPDNYKAWLDDKYLFQASFFWKRWREDYIKWDLKIKFIKNDIIHVLSREEPRLWIKLIDILNTKNVIIIGPDHIKKFTKLKYEHFISIPYRKCYLSKVYIIYQLCKKLNILDEYLIQKKNKYKVGGIKKELVLDVNKSVNIYNNDTTTISNNKESNNKESNNKEYIVLLCSGMLSNCIIDELFPFVKDKHTLLDFGSVFDIFINDSRIVRRSVVKDENLRRVRRLYTKDWIF